jgi:hypothetical protein
MMDVVRLYSFRTEILGSGEQPESAVRMTLATLDCKTADEFLALADRVQFNQTIGDVLLKSEFGNQEPRRELASFIEKSLSASN